MTAPSPVPPALSPRVDRLGVAVASSGSIHDPAGWQSTADRRGGARGHKSSPDVGRRGARRAGGENLPGQCRRLRLTYVPLAGRSELTVTETRKRADRSQLDHEPGDGRYEDTGRVVLAIAQSIAQSVACL